PRLSASTRTVSIRRCSRERPMNASSTYTSLSRSASEDTVEGRPSTPGRKRVGAKKTVAAGCSLRPGTPVPTKAVNPQVPQLISVRWIHSCLSKAGSSVWVGPYNGSHGSAQNVLFAASSVICCVLSKLRARISTSTVSPSLMSLKRLAQLSRNDLSVRAKQLRNLVGSPSLGRLLLLRPILGRPLAP